jgi:hypothetical protein
MRKVLKDLINSIVSNYAYNASILTLSEGTGVVLPDSSSFYIEQTSAALANLRANCNAETEFNTAIKALERGIATIVEIEMNLGIRWRASGGGSGDGDDGDDMYKPVPMGPPIESIKIKALSTKGGCKAVPLTNKWLPTPRKATLKDGSKRILYKNPHYPGDLRIRKMRKGKDNRMTATYVKP